ncbi:hypothetical protein NKH77_53405 [Streptomyces sp. M19]
MLWPTVSALATGWLAAETATVLHDDASLAAVGWPWRCSARSSSPTRSPPPSATASSDWWPGTSTAGPARDAPPRPRGT